MAFRCDGLVCLVTGATSGIGRECCKALANAGAKIFAVGRNSTAGEVPGLCMLKLLNNKIDSWCVTLQLLYACH